MIINPYRRGDEVASATETRPRLTQLLSIAGFLLTIFTLFALFSHDTSNDNTHKVAHLRSSRDKSKLAYNSTLDTTSKQADKNNNSQIKTAETKVEPIVIHSTKKVTNIPNPTYYPTCKPSLLLSPLSPTATPTIYPIAKPTMNPTANPTTSQPTLAWTKAALIDTLKPINLYTATSNSSSSSAPSSTTNATTNTINTFSQSSRVTNKYSTNNVTSITWLRASYRLESHKSRKSIGRISYQRHCWSSIGLLDHTSQALLLHTLFGTGDAPTTALNSAASSTTSSYGNLSIPEHVFKEVQLCGPKLPKRYSIHYTTYPYSYTTVVPDKPLFKHIIPLNSAYFFLFSPYISTPTTTTTTTTTNGSNGTTSNSNNSNNYDSDNISNSNRIPQCFFGSDRFGHFCIQIMTPSMPEKRGIVQVKIGKSICIYNIMLILSNVVL